VRIVYLCADSGVSLAKPNGSAAHLRAIVGSFSELGHEVELLMTDVEGADRLGVPVHAIRRARFVGSMYELAGNGTPEGPTVNTTAVLRALRRIWINNAVEKALAGRLRERPADLVYERHSPFSVAGAATARRLGCTHVLEVNAPLAWEGARHRGQALAEAAEVLERSAFNATSRIVAVSDELREQLIADGVDREKIEVVPNGVDAGAFRPDGATLPDDPGLRDRFVVGFVGSLKAWHGIEVLAEAFAELAVDPDMHLLVVGDGPMADRLEALAREFPGRVTHAGAVPQEEVPSYLRRMQVAVAPYPELERFYFSPLKALEYMACGRAVVVSEIGQLKQLIRHDENGLFVRPGDPKELASAIRRLRDDPALRDRLGRAAREEAERHTWTKRTERILETAGVVARGR
jgi:glycosyltransferase involved in cell wall biosynthesis